MQARIRRRLEMGRRALEFSRANPDESAGYAASLAHLEELLARGDLLADQQLNGIRAVRTSTARKREICRLMKSAHMEHLNNIARLAARDVPELPQKFALPRRGASYAALRTVARTMAAEAANRKELLVSHGLVEQVLDDLNQSVAKFDTAMELGAEGRRTHIGASAELKEVALEVVELVQALDGLNRLRFTGDAERLAAWENASLISDPARPMPDTEAEGTPPAEVTLPVEGTPPATGSEEPAA